MLEEPSPPKRPVIGITCAFDDGTDHRSLRPHVRLSYLDHAYLSAVEAAGGLPILLGWVRDFRLTDQILGMLDGLILSGGGGFLKRKHLARPALPDLRTLSPDRYDFEFELLQRAMAADLPVLGVCRGLQMINRVAGGRLQLRLDEDGYLAHYHEAAPIGRRPVHAIDIVPGSRLEAILGARRLRVNSLHRQAVKSVRPPFVVSARAEDGVVEAIESRAHTFVVGVQYHPELLVGWDRRHLRLFCALVDAARARGGRARGRETGAEPALAVGAPASRDGWVGPLE